MLVIRRAPADYDTQACYLGPTLCHILFKIFIMGGILWLYHTQGLFIICAPNTDVTENSYHIDCSWTAGHKKNPMF